MLFNNKILFIIALVGLCSFCCSAHADSLMIKAHIPWDWIQDFEFYGDGIFISPIGYNGIGYFIVDDSFNLLHQYTIDPGGHCFCVSDSLLFSLSGSSYLCIYAITDSSYEYISNLQLTGSSDQFDPIIYNDSTIICQLYPGDYYRINISDPYAPFVTGKLLNTNDVSLGILPYRDSLLIASRMMGMAGTGNLRVIKNNVPDTLISLGVYGSRPSYTCGIVNIDSILFTAHYDGLVVYNISNPTNIQEIFFYPTAWGRYVEEVNNYIFMTCNDGWHVFQFISVSDISHLQHLPNDTRAMWIKERAGKEELWSFVDGGSLGGLIIINISGYPGVNENRNSASQFNQIDLQISPNPFKSFITIHFLLIQNTYLMLTIYNTQGQLVRELLHGKYSAGTHTVSWNGTDNYGIPVSSGIYFCEIKTQNGVHGKRKVLLVR